MKTEKEKIVAFNLFILSLAFKSCRWWRRTSEHIFFYCYMLLLVKLKYIVEFDISLSVVFFSRFFHPSVPLLHHVSPLKCMLRALSIVLRNIVSSFYLILILFFSELYGCMWACRHKPFGCTHKALSSALNLSILDDWNGYCKQNTH